MSFTVRLLLPAQPVTVKRPSETMRDLEKIIDDLVYRKKNLDLDSPEYQLINERNAHRRTDFPSVL